MPDVTESIVGSPGELQLIVISPENLDSIVEKASAINQAHQRGVLSRSYGPRERGRLREGEEEEVITEGFDSAIASPNGNCPRCTNNLC